MDLEQAIREIVDDPSDPSDFDPRVLGLEFEQMGEVAFDRAMRALREGSVAASGLVRGLRTLGLLSRHFATKRKAEFVSFCCDLMTHRDEAVRSQALLSGVLGARTSAGIGRPLKDVETEALRHSIADAIELGVDPETDALGRGFLSQ